MGELEKDEKRTVLTTWPNGIEDGCRGLGRDVTGGDEIKYGNSEGAHRIIMSNSGEGLQGMALPLKIEGK